MSNILVTGGAGYIGSFMVRALLDKGFNVTVIDSLERGHRDAIDRRANFIKGDIKDEDFLKEVFLNQKFDAILHFAGYISVEESARNPEKYEENNVLGSKRLFDAAINMGNVRNIIFSSTAAVYGNPEIIPIPEDHPKNPTSPYGRTKLKTEENLKQLRENNPDINFVCLRYFNAAGGALDGSMGENHSPETHIIPLAIRTALSNGTFRLYGTDYDTPDGTCIRDYIHVLDLVEAHILALKKLEEDGGGYFYNVGTGRGYSNREVIDMVKKISGADFKVEEESRRSGDADQLIADPSKIRSELGFETKYSDLKTIVESAYKWHVRNLGFRIQNSE